MTMKNLIAYTCATTREHLICGSVILNYIQTNILLIQLSYQRSC